MHETISQNFIGFIDNFIIENGNLRISGWLVTKHNREDVIYFADIGHNIAFYNYNEREDVAKFYNKQSDDFLKSGFDITIPAPNKNEITIFALVRGNKEVIFNLSTTSNTVETVDTRHASETFDIKIRHSAFPEVVVVDNFYDNPLQVRELALQQTFTPDLRYHKGQRTSKKFIAQGTKELFESFLCRKITNWVDYEYNGIFQYCTAEDPLVYHVDVQSYAAAVYLTPNAPVQTGTSFYRSKKYLDTRKISVNDSNYNDVFSGGYYDRTNFEQIDCVGNVFNRLVIWNARLIHSATEYFGTQKDNSRLFHLFFFDIEE